MNPDIAVSDATNSTKTTSDRPELRITVFSDYICPFCYIGHHRLMHLRDTYDLRINWRLIEIHPETPPEGQLVSELGYGDEQWQRMMKTLQELADADGLEIAAHNFTANSRKALLLSEAAKLQGRESFYQLHEKIFHAFFVKNLDIGDEAVLIQLTSECGISKEAAMQAWSDEDPGNKLQAHLRAAAGQKISSVPTFVFGDRLVNGAVPVDTLREAAAELIQGA